MRLTHKSTASLFHLFLSVFLMLNSCSKRERSPVGMSQYPDSLLFSPDTLTLSLVVLDSTYHHFVSTGGSRTLLLGFEELRPEEQYEAWALFRFERGLSDFDSAEIELPLAQPLGDSLEFTVHRISGDWDDTLVTWDELPDYDPIPLIQPSFPPGETLIVVDCPTPETVIAEGDTNLLWNLLLIPTSGGMGKLDSRESESKPAILFYKDTDTTFIHARTDAYVIDYDGDLDTSLLWVGSGWPLRSELEFDISGLPTNSIINRAELTLQVSSPSTQWMQIAAFAPGTGESAIGYVNAGATSTTFLVTDLVQYWVSSENVGLTLKTTDETGNISRVGFFSSDSLDKRPIIRVTYTRTVYED